MCCVTRLPATSGPCLAEMAAEEAAASLSQDAPSTPRLHGSATTQLPINDPERLPQARHRPLHRRALVVAALIVTIIAVGGVTTALMVAGHHAAGGAGSARSASASASSAPGQPHSPGGGEHRQPEPCRHEPGEPYVPHSFSGPPAPALPSPTFSATPSVDRIGHSHADADALADAHAHRRDPTPTAHADGDVIADVTAASTPAGCPTARQSEPVGSP